MHRTDSPGNQAGLYTEGDPGVPIPATTFGADAANAGQEEIVHVIETTAGIPLSKPDNTQLSQAILKIIATKAGQDHNERLVRNSTLQFQIEALEVGVRDFLDVNSVSVSIATPKVCDVSGGAVKTLIAADGTNSLSNPSGLTLYYAYISNANASFAPNELRLSATAPTNGYLGGSGNAANWRFVGAVKTDAVIQIADNFAICGFGIHEDPASAADINRSSGGSGNYDAVRVDDVVMLEKTWVFCIGQHRDQYSPTTQAKGILFDIGGSNRSFLQEGAGAQSAFATHFNEESASIQAKTIALLYTYAGTATIDVRDIRMTVKRVTF